MSAVSGAFFTFCKFVFFALYIGAFVTANMAGEMLSQVQP
jgi:hypothetical protein